MLVSEKKLSAADGVLLWPADRGLNYQTAGAFQRLGGRLLGVVRADSPRGAPSPLPLKIHEWAPGLSPEAVFGSVPSFKTLIWSPHPALSWNEAPDADELEMLIATIKYAAKADPEFHAILVLSQRTPRETLLRLRTLNERATLLLSPLAFGFRDEALFDATLATLKLNSARLQKTSKQAAYVQPVQAVSFADLAAHLIVSPHNDSVVGKNIWVHGAEWTLLEWQQHFYASFDCQPSAWQRLTSQLKVGEALPSALVNRLTSAAPLKSVNTTAANFDFVVHSDQELFPSPTPQLKRALEQHSRAYARYPELELVFTPGRSL